jgi:O-antigen biosynthesis protein
MYTAKVDIVVLTWNQRQIIEDFIKSFFLHTSLPCRLIIIDNGSTDATDKFLLSLKGNEFISLEIVLNKDNKGFVAGMNQGIELSDAEYVCLANNDLIFTDYWLDEILSVFQKDPKVGVLNPNSNNLGIHPAPNESIDTLAARVRFDSSGKFMEMPFCIGFCMFIRREVIQKVGGLSLEFKPMFFEDTDYSLKALKAGYLIGAAKGAYVWHKQHGSFDTCDAMHQAYFDNSKAVFNSKWGKIRRVAVLVDKQDDIREILGKAVIMARNSAFVTLMAPHVETDRTKLFAQYAIIEHTGILPRKISNIFFAFFEILFKKKRYDIVVTRNKLLSFALRACGFKVLKHIEAQLTKVKV